jgi:hypothetical protein
MGRPSLLVGHMGLSFVPAQQLAGELKPNTSQYSYRKREFVVWFLRNGGSQLYHALLTEYCLHMFTFPLPSLVSETSPIMQCCVLERSRYII